MGFLWPAKTIAPAPNKNGEEHNQSVHLKLY